MRRFPKASGERLAYTMNWSLWLGSGLTIATAVFTRASVPATEEPSPALTIEAQSTDGNTLATVEVSGGTKGILYRVTCHVTTNENTEEPERSFELLIEPR